MQPLEKKMEQQQEQLEQNEEMEQAQEQEQLEETPQDDAMSIFLRGWRPPTRPTAPTKSQSACL